MYGVDGTGLIGEQAQDKAEGKLDVSAASEAAPLGVIVARPMEVA